ncbi:hypothetical protein NPIL_90931 [Nephila pilipes]|uniref:Uncharacterized protein n=1 Tax=Nephila pilipes TaxID=299642 RepID=A0A8X6TNL9_NEPPI|nr:hypothetical protein NPIL_90931 [Nephila pilipes]
MRLELASLICGFDSRYSKARYPVSDEAFCHGFSRDITERNDLWSSGVAIDASQQEGEAVRWWKWSDQIDMDVLKSFSGWSKRLYWAHGMPLDRWHAMQHRVHLVMSFSIDGQMKRSWMSRFVARIPGWERL